MNFLVTGGTGLLGREIFQSDTSAVCLGTKDCNLLSLRSEDSFKNKILKLKESGAKIDAVIHCAARVGGLKANTDCVADFFDDNVRMNMNVINACKEEKLKLVSVLSTCIYPDSSYATYPLTEDQLHLGPPHFSNFGYAHAKRMLEVQSRAYRQQHHCNFISVIPNNLYGPNDNYDLDSGHVVPSLIRKFYEAKIHKLSYVEIWGSGKPIREFTFARDAARIILWLAENYSGEEPVNIGNPDSISIAELARIISEEIDYKGDHVFDVNKPDGQFQKPTSNKKLRSLGWNGTYTPLRDGLRETIKSFIDRYPNVKGVIV
jgi:GDP-L-fucose synthase